MRNNTWKLQLQYNGRQKLAALGRPWRPNYRKWTSLMSLSLAAKININTKIYIKINQKQSSSLNENVVHLHHKHKALGNLFSIPSYDDNIMLFGA
jgi:hypothetical protein